MTTRIAYLVTHPIQYQAPLLRRIAAEPGIEIKALFGSDFSVRSFVDADFGQAITWDVPLTEGYDHAFLPQRGAPMRAGEAPSFSRPDTGDIGPFLDGFDVLWVHGYHRRPHLAAIRAARKRGMRVFLRDETNAESGERRWHKELAKQALFRFWLAHAVDAFLCIGTLNRAYWRSLGVPPRKLFDVPYAVDNAFFQEKMRAAALVREDLRAELGLEPGRPIVLFAAKLIERKCPMDLLIAFGNVAQLPECRRPYLLFAGDGELRGAIEAAGVPGVRVLGFQNQARLAALYDLADLFVLPSAREPWGLVVNEAMNAARPVICSDRIGAAPDLIQDGQTGYVYRFGHLDALATALRKTLSDPAHAASMGQKALDRVNGWGFEQDVAGLKAALAATRRA